MDEKTASAMSYVDKAEEAGAAPETIDSSWLRKLALNFEKRISKNAELRAKFEDEPQKFMGSEADLDADIKSLSVLSEHPELYGEFAKLGCAGSLVSLLAHENTDIAIDAIEIISELTDEDVQAEQEQWDALVNGMLEADLLSLLVSNIERLDEANEVDRNGVYHSLSVVENLSSNPSTIEVLGKEDSLLKWLLRRIQKKEKPVSQNKQYAAEDLAILVQTSAPNRLALINLDAIDTILQLLAAYRKRDPPKDTEEEEFAENLFDFLACLVDEPAGKEKFVEAEGIELCLIMLRDAKFAKPRALRLLDHALSGSPAGAAPVCERLVEAAGLKTIFSMFMKKNDGANTEHLIGILAALLRSLPGESAGRIRTLAKFVEKDYEKIGRLIQVRRDYSSRLRLVDQAIQREKDALRPEAREELEDEWFSRRMEGGLFCLQTIDVILSWLVAEDGGAKKRIMELLADRDETLADIRATLKEQFEGITGDDLGEGELMLKDMLSTLIGFLE
ncbi:Catenin-beta-like protein [Phyllosticta citrichinensis]